MKKYLIIILTGYSISGFSQNKYSLADCIDYTLKNHPTIRVYTNNVGIANERGKQNLSGYLPQISGIATTINNLSLQPTVITSSFLGPAPIELTMGSKYATSAYIDVNQALFDKTKVVQIQSGKYYLEKSTLDLKKNEEAIVYNTSTSFFQILIYREQLSILRANKNKYEEMYQVMKYKFEKGVALEKDVNRIKVNLNSVNYQIQDAETKLQLSYNTLKNAMGMALETPLEINASSDYKSFLESIDDGLTVENTIDYKLSENTIKTEENNLKQQQASFFPTLNAVGRFGTQALNKEFSDIYKGWNNFSYVGLSLNVPIFNGFKRKSLVNESKLKLENQIASLDINKDKIKLAYENAKTSLGTAFSNYLSNQDNMTLAKEVLDITDYQYKSGVVNLTDYLNDDTAYKNAQSDYLNSLYNLLISELNYHQSKGTLKEFITQIK